MPKAPDPVVIPPMTGIDDGKFTCIGKGLLFEGHARESSESLRILLFPGVGGEPITDRARPKLWWTAQARHYEISCPKSASIGNIRTALESALKANTLALTSRLRLLENKSNKEFNKLNKEVLEKTGGGPTPKVAFTSKSAGKQASAKPAAAAPAKVVSVKAEPKPKAAKVPKPPPKVSALAGAATAKASASKVATKPKTPKLGAETAALAVPKAEKPVAEKKVKAESKKGAAQVPPAEAPKQYRTVQTAVKRSAGNAFDDPTIASPTKKAKAVATASSSRVKDESDDDEMHDSADEDSDEDEDGLVTQGGRSYSGPAPKDFVAGTWDITCRFIQGGWSQYDYMFTLDIIRTNRKKDIEADFDFGLASGFLRSKTIEGRGKDGAYATYEWVGQENEGRVLPPSRGQTGWLKFVKDGGDGYPALNGGMGGLPACGSEGVTFSGVWRGPVSRIKNCWNDFDQDAYEEADRNRWH